MTNTMLLNSCQRQRQSNTTVLHLPSLGLIAIVTAVPNLIALILTVATIGIYRATVSSRPIENILVLLVVVVITLVVVVDTSFSGIVRL